MFFCPLCRPKITVALRFFSEMKDKQDSQDAKIVEIEDKLTNLTKELKSYSKTPSPAVKESQQQQESLLQQLENKLTSKPLVVPQHIES